MLCNMKLPKTRYDSSLGDNWYTAFYEGLGWANFKCPRKIICPPQYLKLSHRYQHIGIVEWFSEELSAIGQL